MTDADSETLEDVENTPLADMTDDSCVLQLIEIVPLDRPSDDYCKQERIDPVVEVKPEDLQDVKQEPEDNYDFECPCFAIQVRFCDMFMYITNYNWKSFPVNVAVPSVLVGYAAEKELWVNVGIYILGIRK